jgi:hypothetical protein
MVTCWSGAEGVKDNGVCVGVEAGPEPKSHRLVVITASPATEESDALATEVVCRTDRNHGALGLPVFAVAPPPIRSARRSGGRFADRRSVAPAVRVGGSAMREP